MLGLVHVFADDKSKAIKLNLNEDGTIPIDIFRTGSWYHWWHGLIEVSEADLDKMIENFNNKIIGYKVTFNYHHARDKNFGAPIRLRKENRINKFNGEATVMLVADTIPTEQGLIDVESGEVLNFSSEVDHDYIDREVVVVKILNDDGTEAVDENGKPRKRFIQKKYGATLMGGAVTNYPFITNLNPDGIAGNNSTLELSDTSPMVVLNDKISGVDIRCYSTNGQLKLENTIVEQDTIITSIENYELLNKCIEVNNCLYLADDYKAGDADLPDAAFAIVYEEKTKAGNTVVKIRKLPHHNKNVKSPDENSSLDIPRLKNALSRLDQTDAPESEIKKADTHLNKHADATYRKTSKEQKSSMATEETAEQKLSITEAVQAGFTADQIKDMIGTALSDQERSFSQKFETALADRDNKIQMLEDKNSELALHVASEHKKAYGMKIDSFVNQYATSATPAFKETLKRLLVLNSKVTVKYSQADGDIDISLMDAFSKILSEAKFSIDNTTIDSTSTEVQELSSDNGVVQKYMTDDKAYAEMIGSVIPSGYTSKIVAKKNGKE